MRTGCIPALYRLKKLRGVNRHECRSVCSFGEHHPKSEFWARARLADACSEGWGTQAPNLRDSDFVPLTKHVSRPSCGAWRLLRRSLRAEHPRKKKQTKRRTSAWRAAASASTANRRCERTCRCRTLQNLHSLRVVRAFGGQRGHPRRFRTLLHRPEGAHTAAGLAWLAALRETQ